jgi:hypothetical protein
MIFAMPRANNSLSPDGIDAALAWRVIDCDSTYPTIRSVKISGKNFKYDSAANGGSFGGILRLVSMVPTRATPNDEKFRQ